MAEFPSLPIFTDVLMADCGHLTDAEFGLYMRILFVMWRAPECRIPAKAEWLERHFRRPVIEIVPLLAEFCQNDGNWWTQKRLLKERAWVVKNSNRQRDRAKSLWNKRKDPCRVDAELHRSGNAPIPIPIPIPTVVEDTNVSSTPVVPKVTSRLEGFKREVTGSVWADFEKHRKAKKAPVTETVLVKIKNEADKAGWTLNDALAEICARNWQGFKAEWVNNKQKGNSNDAHKHNQPKASYLDKVASSADGALGMFYADQAKLDASYPGLSVSEKPALIGRISRGKLPDTA